MIKDIKDYLHLYLGCECLVQFPEDRDGIKCILDGVSYYFDERECGVKLLLRPLSDMTEDERLERGKAIITHDKQFIEAEYHRWMLSKGFDLFGLIEAGLAIDKTKLVTT